MVIRAPYGHEIGPRGKALVYKGVVGGPIGREIDDKGAAMRYSGIARVGWYCLGLVMLAASMSGHLSASEPLSAPEIGPGSIATGLGLLTAGALVLKSRRSK